MGQSQRLIGIYFFNILRYLLFISFKNAYILEFGLMIHVVLQRKVTWRVEDEEKVKKNFHTKASHTLSQMFKMAR